MRDPLISLPGYVLRRAANATDAELSERLAPLGMRQSIVSVLLLISENPGVTASAVGRKLDIQRANMAPMLKRLEDAGLIDRLPLDGKSLGLDLTDAGRAKVAKARAVVAEFEDELLQRIPLEHRAHVLPALTALWRQGDQP